MSKYTATFNSQEIPVEIEKIGDDQLKIVSGETEWILDVRQAGPHHYSVVHQNQSYDIRFFHDGSQVDAYWYGEHLSFQIEDERTLTKRKLQKKGDGPSGSQGPVEIKAMMPGKVVAVKVQTGDFVKEGQGVVVLEAMKMENELAAPKDGKVSQIKVQPGDSVESGAVLVVVE